jgi:hypothetical protein
MSTAGRGESGQQDGEQRPAHHESVTDRAGLRFPVPSCNRHHGGASAPRVQVLPLLYDALGSARASMPDHGIPEGSGAVKVLF